MNILDENVPESQCTLLRSRRVAVRQIGQDVGRMGMKDDEIVGVIGIFRQEVRTFTVKQIALLTSFGAQAVIAGCTEVPLVLSQSDLPVPLVSSTDALVERVIVEAGAELKAE